MAIGGTFSFNEDKGMKAREEAMQAQVIGELQDFHRFLGDKLRDGHINWSPEEALDEWRRLRARRASGG